MTTIFLLPYGGASASSFRSYVDRFPRETGHVVPVELPGRGKRSHEASAASIRECAALALQQIDTGGEGYILHGHCMGALLAFEAIKLIEASGERLPRFMVASGRNAPRYVNQWLRRVVELDDRGFLKELQDIGGVPKGLSFAMAQQFLNVVRNDQAMARDYDPGDTRISVPSGERIDLAREADGMNRVATGGQGPERERARDTGDGAGDRLGQRMTARGGGNHSPSVERHRRQLSKDNALDCRSAAGDRAPAAQFVERGFPSADIEAVDGLAQISRRHADEVSEAFAETAQAIEADVVGDLDNAPVAAECGVLCSLDAQQGQVAHGCKPGLA